MKSKDKMSYVMDEFKSGKLKSSSGKKVTNPKQAVAIGLSESYKGKNMKPMKSYAKGGMAKKSSCAYRKSADGVAKKGRTKPKMMRQGGKACK